LIFEFTNDLLAAALPDAALAFLSFEDALVPPEIGSSQGPLREVIDRALSRSRFTGALGQYLDFIAPCGTSAARILLIGCGAKAGLAELGIERAAADAYRRVHATGATILELRFDLAYAKDAAAMAFGVQLAAYRFDKYRTREKSQKKPSISVTRIVSVEPEAARAAFQKTTLLADAIYFCRDQVSEPANVLYPTEFARRIRSLDLRGMEVEVLGEDAMRQLGMNALLGVGQGSRRQSQLVIMRWNGGRAEAPPIAFIGKGVCYDSGGLSIKPAKSMAEMKWDMGGAAVVAGLLHALAAGKARANVIGILGLVENMPDGNAQRPGDVVTSMSGQTIEVVDTDAEGRLVLADALWYCQQRFKPQLMIDVATLTGAVEIALGQEFAGLFSNDDTLADQLLRVATLEGEKLWRLPLAAALEKQIESPIADLKNYGGPEGGAITAALFLQHFVKGCPWAHLDVAATTWQSTSSIATVPDGATGFGVRILHRLVTDYYDGAVSSCEAPPSPTWKC
jgi:leucyl aminopeptidase